MGFEQQKFTTEGTEEDMEVHGLRDGFDALKIFRVNSNCG
jgi:hypothetical protein